MTTNYHTVADAADERFEQHAEEEVILINLTLNTRNALSRLQNYKHRSVLADIDALLQDLVDEARKEGAIADEQSREATAKAMGL